MFCDLSLLLSKFKVTREVTMFCAFISLRKLVPMLKVTPEVGKGFDVLCSSQLLVHCEIMQRLRCFVLLCRSQKYDVLFFSQLLVSFMVQWLVVKRDHAMVGCERDP